MQFIPNHLGGESSLNQILDLCYFAISDVTNYLSRYYVSKYKNFVPMTLEFLIASLKNASLDLESKVTFLSDFYFQSQENATVLANLNDTSQIDLISLGNQINLFLLSNNELSNIDRFEDVFFDVICLTSQIDFSKFLAVTLSFNQLSNVNSQSQRLYYLKKVAQQNKTYAQYLFNYIVANLDKHYNKLYLAVASLTIFEPIEVKNFISIHFDLSNKNIDYLLHAVTYMNYPLYSDALEILSKINILIKNNELNSPQFSQILEIASYIYLQHNNIEKDIIDIIELISRRANITELAEKSASLLFFNRTNLSKNLKQAFYQILLDSKSISHQTCNYLSLIIPNQKTDEDSRKLIELIEQLLLKHENITIQHFAIYYFIGNLELLNKVVTRWFLSKKRKLWEAASTIITSNQVDVVNMNTSWVDSFKEEDYFYLTKKAVGWIPPIYEEILLRFIMSILKILKDIKIANQILDLVFQHVIINYNPQHVAFFFELNNYTDEEIKKRIIELKVQHGTIFKNIEQASILNELTCPLEHSRSIQYKKHRENEKINKAADQQSALSDIFSKTIMLYGDRLIHNAVVKNEEDDIQETELGSFSHTLILPLQYFTDPILLEYQRIILMSEGME